MDSSSSAFFAWIAIFSSTSYFISSASFLSTSLLLNSSSRLVLSKSCKSLLFRFSDSSWPCSSSLVMRSLKSCPSNSVKTLSRRTVSFLSWWSNSSSFRLCSRSISIVLLSSSKISLSCATWDSNSCTLSRNIWFVIFSWSCFSAISRFFTTSTSTLFRSSWKRSSSFPFVSSSSLILSSILAFVNLSLSKFSIRPSVRFLSAAKSVTRLPISSSFSRFSFSVRSNFSKISKSFSSPFKLSSRKQSIISLSELITDSVSLSFPSNSTIRFCSHCNLSDRIL